MMIVVCLLWNEAASAFEAVCDDFGARAGISFSDDNDDEDFEGFDIFGRWDLPWRWQTASGLTFATRLEATAGVLQGESDSALLLAAAPEFRISGEHCPLGLAIGIGPAFVSEDRYAETDIGGNLQFIAHATLFYVWGDHFELEYRVQHMSNGGIGSPNPGINMHMIGITFSF